MTDLLLKIAVSNAGFSSMNPKPHSYAKSIFAAVESLACPAVRPPAMASEVNSGGFLERRFKMIVSASKNPNRTKSRWLQAFVLLCAMIVLPLGVASAQDLGAVWQRLQTAVKKGEITEKEAHIMMGALKKATAKAKDSDDRKKEHRDTSKPNLEQIGKRLKSAVASGQMSEKDARAKWEAINKEAKSRDGRREHGQDDRARAEAHIREVWERLQHAVKAGKISEEDALRKIGEIKREIHAKLEGGERREKGGSAAEEIGRWVKSVGEDIRKAAESGKITGEQAMRKWQGFKEQRLAPKLKAAVKEGRMSEQGAREFWRQMEIGEAESRLKHAVRAGKISKEDAERKMGEIKREIDAKFKGGDRREHGQDDRARAEAHIKEVWEHLQGAVKAGKISEEDAHKKMGEVKKRLYSHDQKDPKPDPAREHLMKIRRELGAAVEAGKISREDAGRRFAGAEKAILERMAAGGDQRGPKRITEEDLSRAGIEIRKAVASGRITAEQGRARMVEMRKMMDRQGERGAEKAPAGKPARIDWKGIERRIEGAVKRGDMTRREADAKYREIRERMGRQGERRER